MRYFKLILQDIRSGRNIDIYATIFVVILVALVDILNISSQEFISSAILLVLALVSSSLLQDRRSNQPPVTICSNNETNMNYLFQYIATHRTSKAQLIQYSGDMARQVIEKLLDEGAKVELLLQHPNKAFNKFQSDKIALFYKRVSIDFRNKNNLVVRYYKESASIRGIKLDNDFLSVGWYTLDGL
ncbi:MAG: hypothetical protein WA783_21845 [Phormidesmis sp.]